jgi:hypothetical protein
MGGAIHIHTSNIPEGQHFGLRVNPLVRAEIEGVV